jgi:methyl-accepting chemotaxis protein
MKGTPRPVTDSRRLWSDRSVRTKILIAIAAAAVAVLVGLLGLRALDASSVSNHMMYVSNVKGVEHLGTLNNEMTQTRLDLLNHLVYSDAASKRTYRSAVDDDFAAVAAAFTAMRPPTR